MTKSLLTSKDIKNFILVEIQKVNTGYDGCLTLKAIADRLNITTSTVYYHKHKIPYEYLRGKTKFYKISKVIQYFLDAGYDVKYSF